MPAIVLAAVRDFGARLAVGIENDPDRIRQGRQAAQEAGLAGRVEFIQGDPRAPLITGWRNPIVGNSLGWRRWHHKNVQILADDDMRLDSGKTIHIEAGTYIQLKVGGSTIKITAADITALAGKINLN